MGILSKTSETGNYESFARTIGALLKRSWTTSDAELNDPKPAFLYDDDSTNIDLPKSGSPAIAVKDGSTFPMEQRTSLDHEIIGDSEILEIIIQAGNIKLRKKYEEEIKRILTGNRPSRTGSYIKKSDNSTNSAIHDYDEILPPFIPFGIEDLKGRVISSKSSALLTVIWEWQYTS